MRTITEPEWSELITRAAIAPRLKRELRFEASVSRLHDGWKNYELVAVRDRSGAHGVLLIEPEDELYIIQYDLSPLGASSATGRTRSIICDFCSTWQRGSNAGSITLINRTSKRTVRFLCCEDLDCSGHVRSRTEAARISRTQLRENLDDERRVARLKRNLQQKMADLEVEPVGI